MNRTNISLIAFGVFCALLFGAIFVVPPYVTYEQALAFLAFSVLGMWASTFGLLGFRSDRAV
jgi:hypothetical protein